MLLPLLSLKHFLFTSWYNLFTFVGAFFIPYFIMLILEGIPLICLEMAVGQRLGRNSVMKSWKDLSPSLRGIGMAATIESLVTCFYYNYIVAWCLYYFIHSMRSSLLWTTCPTINDTVNGTLVPECSRTNPAEYYWYRETLDVAEDINKSTGKKWRILIEMCEMVILLKVSEVDVFEIFHMPMGINVRLLFWRRI